MTSNPTAAWIAGQVADAFPWDEAPRLLIRDRDGAFGPACARRIRANGDLGSPDCGALAMAERSRRGDRFSQKEKGR